MRLLYVYDKGMNCKYWDAMLPRMAETYHDFNYCTCQLRNYENLNHDDFDILVYQTFPDEGHRWKFEHTLVEKTDQKFLSFKGMKILFDSKDGTNENGFPRFGTNFPRIKHVGGNEYSEKFNLFLIIPGALYPLTTEPKSDRNVLIHYSPSMRARYPHKIRGEVLKILLDSFNEQTNFTRISKYQYSEFLGTVLISVTVPGYGDTSGAAYHSLLAGSCLFAHEWIKRIKLLPYSDLIDGEDFVSFSLDNLEVRLRELLDDRDRTIAIGMSGRKKFIQGMDINRSCQEMYLKLKEMV